MRQTTARDLTVFCLLLAIGVVGRWIQPTWNFTPLAAVTAIGGYYFRSLLAAVLLPATILALTDLALPIHDNLMVQVSVHVMMIVPLLLGRAARRATPLGRVAYLGLSGFVPATAFFVVTNFAVWAFRSDYDNTLLGLTQCYTAALPFYRAMLAGDLFYLTVLVGCLAAAGELGSRQLQPAEAPLNR